MISDEQVMSRPKKAVYKWDEIDWRKLERSVFKLQKRIYQTSKSGDWKRMKRLQKLLLKSKGASSLSEESLKSTKARKLLELME